MKVVTRITFWDDNGEKFFGEGPARLLKGIEEHGSLRSAAMAMDMAYTKALKLMKNAESALGFSLTTRVTGGKDGGGSVLTPEGKAWLSRYEAYAKACEEANLALFRRFYPKVGCVIMASGLGKRFGSNKLMADFHGKPMILQALEASRSLKDNRVVVTRHTDVAKLCREQGVNVVFHDLPHRSDTVRLGLEALGDVDCCMFLPGDQPLLRPETLELLVARWENDQQKIIRPFCEDTPGSPVVFPKWAFEQLRNLPEGKGGGWVMKQHPESVAAVPIREPYELMDADTPETLEMLRNYGQTKMRKDQPMIRKTEKLVITFFTTTDAMAMERICKQEKAEGRIIPVPGSISANCGLAWCAALDSEPPLRELMHTHGLRFQGIYRCLV